MAQAQIAVPGAQAKSVFPSAETVSGPKEYTIAGISTKGINYLEEDLVIAVTGLSVGKKIKLPGDESISRAIRNLWKQELFSDVNIAVDRILEDKVFLVINIEERPRLSRWNYRGIRKGEAQELNKKINLIKSKVLTDAIKKESVVRIEKYFDEKGYSNVIIKLRERPDTLLVNSVILTFDITVGKKTKINQINIVGNEHASEARLKRTMKGTKESGRISLHRADDYSVLGSDNKRSFGKYLKNFGFLSVSKTLDALDPYFRPKFLKSSKFNREKYEEDKDAILQYYNTLGYRDANISKDTIYNVAKGNINIDLRVNEGRRYYFGDIKWKGNTKYSDETLTKLLGIKRGDIYDQELLARRTGSIPDAAGQDISSLYMDDGYLYFRIEPMEISIDNDTINYEIRISEGSQATINNVTIEGNDRTNERVIRRELRTLPGAKFSRADIINTQRRIANLGFFNPEKTIPTPHPRPDGTVDINYAVEEKSSDQLQMSMGFGGGVKFYGQIGVTFNNFSLRNLFKPKLWDPLPVGDGQRFAVNYSSNGLTYNALNVSLTEPWLGGKKPISLTTNFIYSKYSSTLSDNSKSFIKVVGGGMTLSRQVKWPDDNFVVSFGLNYQNYQLQNYSGLITDFTNGFSNNLYAKFSIQRYSLDQPQYPRNGSDISFSFQFTPPYSTFSGIDYSQVDAERKYKWVEYHKYRFKADWYKTIYGNFVFKFSAKMGFLGYYNPDIGLSPFERFQLGGDGLSGQNFFIGRDVISQRGYDVYAQNATIFNKYVAEIRYPFSLNPTTTIFGLIFADAGNAWSNFGAFNPTRLNRDVGVGVRLYLPMFGLLGLDYGIGLDRYQFDPTGQTKTSLKDMSKITFMLGFEPE
ncbi:POTRA domain-containing protein [Rurimicrobium arvi]|uniref:POTRA domain-containing protein n=2 Tax=Rurimicrobium arvi TaxID=2049916 RepID=A0ABP8MPX3_9BACT